MYQDLVNYEKFTHDNIVIESLRKLQNYVNVDKINLYQKYVKIVCDCYTGGEYSENHHILPKCIGGGDGANLVRLKAQDHFIVHRLLSEFCINELKSKMVFAFDRMCNTKNKYIIDEDDYTNTKINKSNAMKERWTNVEYRREMSKMSKDMWSDAVFVNRISEKRKLMYKSTEMRNFMSKIAKDYWGNEDNRIIASNKLTGRWKDPEQRESFIKAINSRITPQYKNNLSLIMKNKWQCPIYRKNMINLQKELWTDNRRNDASCRMKLLMSDPYRIEQSRQQMIKQNKDPTFRKKQLESLDKLNNDEEFQEHRKRMLRKSLSGGIYVTPAGNFETSHLAAEPNGVHFNVVLARCKGKSRAKSKKARDKQRQQWLSDGWDFIKFEEE